MLGILGELVEQNIISRTDYYFAKFIHEKQQGLGYSEQQQNLAILLAVLCSYNYQQGNTALFLQRKNIELFNVIQFRADTDYLDEIQQKIDYLPVNQWQACLHKHIAFTADPLNQVAPLVFQFNALYFYRTWQDEYRVACYLQGASLSKDLAPSSLVDEQKVRSVLQKYFPTTDKSTGINWQKVAVATALRQRFCLITGGPGTGKTTTVTRLLLALQELHQNGLQIKLVAPTGKAAARLTESINGALSTLQQKENIIIEPELLKAIPTHTQTLHRLLGIRFFEDTPRFNHKNPLLLDVLVVDEASMIDLPMMAKLVRALKPQTKLILLGDENQLSPVDAGEMLGELSQFSQQPYSQTHAEYLKLVADEQVVYGEQPQPLRDCLCRLVHSHRFTVDSGIGHLARAINEGNVQASLQCFEHASDLHWHPFDEQQTESQSADLVVKSAVEYYRTYLELVEKYCAAGKTPTESQVKEIFTAFNQVRFLAALRGSALGVETLNQQIAQGLRQQGLLRFKNERDWYLGKPIMITQNDSNVGLYNGDIGLYLGSNKLWFEQGQNTYRTVLSSRVPESETAFVMTIHKSQGSEFAHTLLVLPYEKNNVLSKELVYTGVTRAKQKLTVFSLDSIWRYAVRNPICRQSGLAKQLMKLLA